jgi:pimeloyl-ACP methyl ester carboxylesterase
MCPAISFRVSNLSVQVIPSEKLVWHRCYGNLRCARLTVPMDYNRPLNASKNNPKVDIALLMVPGRNHTESGEYSKSPLLINPGGPGGSGVAFAMIGGASLQQVVGLDQDIIGFDPRGIGQTTPVADCWAFPSDRKSVELTPEEISQGFFHKFLWALSGQENGIVNSSADSLAKLDTRDRASARLCEEKESLYGQDSILHHVSTPAVARDMLSIVDAWDEWMEEKKNYHSHKHDAQINPPEAADEEKSLDTKGKLVYWGFSYGTLLGATFAAMFPDRVGRVILDGVVDADYYVAPIWEESLLDADKIMISFFHFCHKAGKKCALYREGDSELDIQARYQETMDNLKSNPIKGVNPNTLTPVILTHDLMKMIIFQILYSPIAAFPIMAELLDMQYRRDEKTLLSIFMIGNGINLSVFCSNQITYGYEGRDAQLAIMCSDKRYPVSYNLPSISISTIQLTTYLQLNESIPNLQARFEGMAEISSFADVWMTLMIGCDSWSIAATDPPMRWDDHPAHKPKPIKTSFPLLFLSNSQDPVTPLKAGVKMARKFVDAGLVEQHGAGHCSLAAASLCTLKKIRAYLGEGKVPPSPEWGPKGREIEDGKWDRCARDDWPWKNRMSAWKMECSAEHHDLDAEAAEDQNMMCAWSYLRDASAMHLKFWNLRDMGLEIRWWRLAELRGEAKMEDGKYVLVKGEA